MDYKDTKLIVFLKTFSKEELNELEKFIPSFYFKQNRDPLPLLKILKNHHPDFNSESFNEESIFNKLYPDLEYSNKNSQNIFRSLSSYLLKSIEEFIFISRVKNNNVLKNRVIMESLLDRNLLKYYDHYLNFAEEKIKENESIKGKDSIENIILTNINSRYYSLKLDFKNYLDNNINGIISISSYFLLNLLRTAKTIFLTESKNKIKKSNKSINGLLEAIDIEKILEIYKGTSGYAELYFNYYNYLSLISEKKFEYYLKAKEMFFENKSCITRTEMIYYYADLMNVLNYYQHNEDSWVRKELYSLSISCLKDKAYKVSEEDFMQPDFYRNTVIHSLRQKEFAWTENFINEYTTELKPEYRENMMHFSKAELHYGKGEFEKSMESVSKVKYELAVFKMDVKIIMLRIFYELEMYDQFYSLEDTFKHFIKNSQMTEEYYRSYLNYIKFFHNIIELKSLFNKNEAEFLRNQIRNEKYLHNRNWLIDKLNELELLHK